MIKNDPYHEGMNVHEIIATLNVLPPPEGVVVNDDSNEKRIKGKDHDEGLLLI